ncbi:MAG: hypothetical protein K5696_13060 [Lachnospiraceae bacterium]|nr:hypothetical protein [Lachnospiraceae bacterium]
MKKVVMKTLILAGVIAAAVTGQKATAQASSLYNTLQELYNGMSAGSQGTGTGTTSGTTTTTGSYGTTGNSGFGSTASSRGYIYYAINPQTTQKITAKDVSGNDISGNSTTIEPQNVLMDTYPIGPTVADVSMSELFHENYGVYEERISDGYSVYTNVSNGSITDRPVIFDVPAGVIVSMTRDGNRADFNNRVAIDREGYYVLMMYIVKDEEREEAFARQTVSRAKFRFRIQYDEGIGGFSANETESAQQEAPAEDFSSIIDQELRGSEEVPPEDEKPAEEQILEPQTQEELKPVGYSNGLTTEYDAASGYYRHTLKTGSSFYSNAVNGEVTNDPIMVQVSDTVSYELYRNGDSVEEFTPGEYITEAGSYELIPYEETDAFTKEYGSNRPLMRFRIIDPSTPVHDLGILNAPEGTVYTQVEKDGLPADAEIFLNEQTLDLEQDGEYRIGMTSEPGESELTVLVDKTAPRFVVTTRPNLATVAYQTGDVDRVMVWRGSDLVDDGNVISSITSPGRYTMTVYDKAGNSSTQSFVVSYRINAAAVIAILIVIALMAGLGFFVYKVRSSVTVR